MKHFFVFGLLLFASTCFAQQNDEDTLIDTSSNTQVERLLRQTSMVRKVEYVDVHKVKLLNFRIIVITDLKSGSKVKGLCLSNDAFDVWVKPARFRRFAYLDEFEIADLILFLENCDQKWKLEKPDNLTQYEFETLDNLRIRFWTVKNKSSWLYEVIFSNYRFENSVSMSKNQSDDLLAALKEVQSELDKR